MNLPELVILDKNVEQILRESKREGVLFVTDPFNHRMVSRFGDAILVTNRNHRLSFKKPPPHGFRRIIAIGGCSALDVGRWHSLDRPFTGIPTILSTSCISVNRSILRTDSGTARHKTVIAEKTVIPLKTILSTEPRLLRSYSASGLGDLLANISASIHYGYTRGLCSRDSIIANAGEAFDALDWIISDFAGYDEGSVRRIAAYLHNSSLDVIRRGSTDLSAGFEHEFYERIIERQDYSSEVQTHGFLVALGTLITVSVFEKIDPAMNLSPKLREAFRKTGIPDTYEGLGSLGIEKAHIIDTLHSLSETENFVCRHFEESGYSSLDEILSER